MSGVMKGVWIHFVLSKNKGFSSSYPSTGFLFAERAEVIEKVSDLPAWSGTYLRIRSRFHIHPKSGPTGIDQGEVSECDYPIDGMRICTTIPLTLSNWDLAVGGELAKLCTRINKDS